MIESQIISKILEEQSLDQLITTNVTVDYFVTYNREAAFLFEHYNNYKKIPTKETFLGRFTDFELVSPDEEWSYLLVQLREGYMFNQLSILITKTVPTIESNALEGFQIIKDKINELENIKPITTVDIIKDAEAREDFYIKRGTNEGESIIPSGLPELDEKIFGWNMGEELVTIMGRTNQGKSWLLMKFLMEAWSQGKRVGLYSGEMSAIQIGYRFDALYKHYSNLGLIKGDQTIKDEYGNYIKDLKNSKVPFVVITPAELGHLANVNDIDYMIKKYDLDIVGIDQFSLMTDVRSKSGEQLRIRLGNISSDLFNLSMKYKIPIIALSQANRMAAKGDVPELEHMSESDAISHNSTKIISMGRTPAGLKLSVVKNRYGKVGDELIYKWDIDTGEFYFISEGYKDNNKDASEVDKEPLRRSYDSGSDTF